MRRSIGLLLIVCLLSSTPAAARMYQWLESGTGTVQLSGDPPPWYRNGREGPRILVFENGRLIDDTSITLPREKEEALRNAAYREVDLKREMEAVKKLERAALREARLREESEAVRQRAAAEAPAAAPEAEPEKPVTAEDLDAKTVEQMKSLISAWDKQNNTGKSP